MKIVLLEPLGVSKETLEKLSLQLTDSGHQFTAYVDFTTDTEELIRRTGDADIVMLANHPLPGEVIRSDPDLKFISGAVVGIDRSRREKDR